jgi:AmmeMemoRadiSam system protein A
MHPLVQFARDAVQLFVREGGILTVDERSLPEEFRTQAGVFVCLKVNGRLRGCIGTFQPAEPTVAHETVRNAVSAATCDPRFACIRPEELDTIQYTVDVLTAPEPIQDRSALDPARYGVIVQSGGRRGLLLPDLDGVDAVDDQVSIAMQKAGIPPGSPVQLYRFEVKRYT